VPSMHHPFNSIHTPLLYPGGYVSEDKAPGEEDLGFAQEFYRMRLIDVIAMRPPQVLILYIIDSL